ncbi:hypothetical protein AB205_0150160 [Aquarana catesbeiana]|uniref:Uncharacterized protein n=1 Tax=Aquarana catesbeiana TaxID=8400 RepID=A0A2G9RNC7_AQUCT|nr:hypothetical protein AB205_0150160 [Aquarana catesbeiana]
MHYSSGPQPEGRMTVCQGSPNPGLFLKPAPISQPFRNRPARLFLEPVASQLGCSWSLRPPTQPLRSHPFSSRHGWGQRLELLLKVPTIVLRSADDLDQEHLSWLIRTSHQHCHDPPASTATHPNSPPALPLIPTPRQH